MIAEKNIADVFKSLRDDFPILKKKVNGKSLIYFDSGATSQKPQQVIDAITGYYREQNANIHRGVHTLSQEITTAYENSRAIIQKHLKAAHAHEIIFTKGTTDSINLVASTFGKEFIKPGDEILITEMEHHSNILPWQQCCEEHGATLKVIPTDERGELKMDNIDSLVNDKTKLLAITHVSNTLGTINPIKDIIKKVRELNHELVILVDGAQAAPHMSIDVIDLDADLYCFSSHKMYGPTGVGILYGKEKILNTLPNYQVGGGTIKTVGFEKTEYAGLPLRFEAGTPHIEGAIGLAAAVNYLNEIGLDAITDYESELTKYAHTALKKIDGLRIIGEAASKASVISFVVGKNHPYDMGVILDQLGIAVRTGHHCTQPLMARFNIPGTVRASLAFYNTKDEIDQLVAGVKKATNMLQ